ncbi:MAG TPA: hypothetical protein DDZ89_19315, partial [Clostridiales bacterium]|nr:hypothetical protein [Clostridiales bacterium]
NQRNSQSRDGGSILRFVPSDNSVGVMRAFDRAAYSDVDVYDRELVYVPVAKAGPEGYILDIFRVSGGSRHEYALNMCADHDYELTTDIKWQYQSETMLPEGVKYTKPTGESDSGNASGHYTAYMFVKDVQSAELKDQPYKISYKITEDGLIKNVGLNIFGTDNTGELLMGKVPSMRATRKSTTYDLNDQCDDYQMDKMVLRREGENLDSCFVTLMEPFSEKYKATVTDVEKLSIKGVHEFDIAVKVTGEGFTDYIFSAYQEDMEVMVDNIHFKGQFGYVRIQDRKAVVMQSLNADVLSYDNAYVPKNRSVSGVIKDVLVETEGDELNGFVTDVKPDEGLKGQYVIVKHPDHTYTGYKIKGIVENGGVCIIDIGDAEPGFDFVGAEHTKMMYYPHKERKGVTEFTIEDTGIVRAE